MPRQRLWPDLPVTSEAARQTIAARRIAEARRSRSQLLDLSGLALTRLPRQVASLTALKSLNLNENRLSALPPAIRRLTALQRLDFRDNRVREIPNWIGELRKLRVLYFPNNFVRKLPAGVSKLEYLTFLSAPQNELTALPEALRSLKHLEKLYIGHNKIQSLPDWIAELRSLRQLGVQANGLTNLPRSLRDLPLEKLILEGNPKLLLPVEFAAKNDSPAELLSAYFHLRDNARRELREVKVLFLGRGAVGKTSLIKCIRSESFDKNEETTHGIRIHSCDLPLLAARKRKAIGHVTAHVWDFGGQEIMHATHQFFLSRRSVYVVVLSGRTGRADEDAEYWLRLVASLGGDSPIIVVRNKIDSEYFELDEAVLRAAHPSIAAFVATDAATGTGVEALRTGVIRAVASAPGVRQLFPENWFRIKEALRSEMMREAGRSWMRFPEFRAFCATHGETDTSAQEQLATWLHDLGIALNYREDQRLSDTTVLDPLWVTGGIYALLTSTGLAKAGGVLRESDVEKLLLERGVDVKNYPPDLQRFLVALMKKFELAYSLPGKGRRTLVPELLPGKQPAAAVKFPRAESIAIRFRYHVLLEGIVPRFITRMRFFLERKNYWRRGVILQYEGARALVVASDFDRTITIWAFGPAESRYRLLAIARSDSAQRFRRDARTAWRH